MHCAYLNHPRQLLTYLDSSQTDIKILRGFKIDVDTFETIRGKGAKHFFLFFCTRKEDIEGPSAKQRFTIAVSGADAGNVILTNNIYDYLDPCPDKCPNNIPFKNALPVKPDEKRVLPFDEKSFARNEIINLQDAERMQHTYMGHDRKLMIPGVSGDETLKGLWFPLDLISNLIKDGAKKIFVMFAVRKEHLGMPKDQQYFTTLIGGINADCNITKMYNHWDPYPNRKPLGLNAK